MSHIAFKKVDNEIVEKKPLRSPSASQIADLEGQGFTVFTRAQWDAENPPSSESTNSLADMVSAVSVMETKGRELATETNARVRMLGLSRQEAKIVIESMATVNSAMVNGSFSVALLELPGCLSEIEFSQPVPPDGQLDLRSKLDPIATILTTKLTDLRNRYEVS